MRETRHDFFDRRIQELGAADQDSDYGGMVGRCVLDLSRTFANVGHSGASAQITMQLFNQLMNEWDDPAVKKLTTPEPPAEPTAADKL